MEVDTTLRKNSKACDICRKRRVKCDKVLPKCRRCIKGKYSCTYYDIPKKVLDESKHVDMGKKSSYKQPYSKDMIEIKIQSAYDLEAFVFSQKITRPKHLEVLMNTNFMFKLVNSTGSFVKRQQFFQLNKGAIRYFPPPLVVPLLMYTMYNRKKHHVDIELENNKLSLTNTFTTENLNLLDIYDSSGQLFLNTTARRCISAYFNYYHPYLAIFNKSTFLGNLPAQAPMLVYLVCSSGSNYLSDLPKTVRDYYGSKAVDLFNNNYLKADLTTLTCLAMFCNFMHDSKDYNRGYFYIGLAVRMSYLLNLDRVPSHLSTEVLEWRRKLWMWCHNIEKFYYFGLNRPCCHDFFYSEPSPPQHYELDVIDFKDPEEVSTAQLSLIYNRFTYELCKLKFLIMRRFRFIEEIDQANLHEVAELAKKTGQHLDIWLKKVVAEFSKFNHNCSNVSVSVSNKFENLLRLMYYGTLVQLYQNFSKLTTGYKGFFQKQCIRASALGIELFYQNRVALNFCGNGYRFYGLACLTLYQINQVKESCDIGVIDNAKNLIRKSVNIFNISKDYHAVAAEVNRVIESLIKTENICL